MNRLGFIIIFSLFYLATPRIYGQESVDSLRAALRELREKVNRLEEKQEAGELKELLREAEAVSSGKDNKNENKIFKSGQRSLQSINPEISVTGDMYGIGIANSEGYNEQGRNGAFLRVLGLHIQSNLDPFSLVKIALGASPNGLGIGEAYVTWTNFIKNISLTAGKFRQQFGVINRWHAHGLDQFDYPLALTTVLGPGGLNQMGISFDWLMPAVTADANTLTLQITNGQNDHLFGGKMFSAPSVLGHLKNYYDLSRNAYIELGLTGMWGRNNRSGIDDNGNAVDEPERNTWLAGLDLTYMWEPVNQSHYHSFLWRSELYMARKDSLNGVEINTLGGYSYIQYKLNERFYIGLRGDYTQPLVSGNSGKYIYQIVPYVTWWQSHWARFRLQYNYKDGNTLSEASGVIRLQLTFAVGPHKHERY